MHNQDHLKRSTERSPIPAARGQEARWGSAHPEAAAKDNGTANIPLGAPKLTTHRTVRGNLPLVLTNSRGNPSVLPLVNESPPPSRWRCRISGAEIASTTMAVVNPGLVRQLQPPPLLLCRWPDPGSGNQAQGPVPIGGSGWVRQLGGH